MEHWVDRGELRIEPAVAAWLEREAAPAANIPGQAVWTGLAALTRAYGPLTADLLAARGARLARLDAWHANRAAHVSDAAGRLAFLGSVGWLCPDPEAAALHAGAVEPLEASVRAAPQIVVPLSDPAGAAAALAARWARLEAPTGLLDTVLPLAGARWHKAEGLAPGPAFAVRTAKGEARLADPGADLGRQTNGAALLSAPSGLRLRVSTARDGGLEVELERAGSVRLEMEGDAVLPSPQARIAAWATFADALAAADADGEVIAPGGTIRRETQGLAVMGGLAGFCDTMRLAEDGRGRPVLPMLFDLLAMALSLKAAMVSGGTGPLVLTLPELDGPEEVALAVELAASVERICLLAPRSLCLGLTASRRRVEANLAACIAAAPGRFALLGLGGGASLSDALRMEREAGPLPAPEALAAAPWAEATERLRHAVAERAGLFGRAVVLGTGPGMVAQVRNPDEALRAAEMQLSQGGARLHEALPLEVPPREAVLDHPREAAPAPDGALAAAVRRVLAHCGAWVGEGRGRIRFSRDDSAEEILCPARARAEALWLVGQMHHGRIGGQDLLRLMRSEAKRLNAAARAAGQPAAFGADCEGHAFQAACDLVFREGDWPVGDAMAVLRERRAEALFTHEALRTA
ncbi:MAG: hypothetical protein AAFU80_25570 [Pseudomonadota bacterium]